MSSRRSESCRSRVKGQMARNGPVSTCADGAFERQVRLLGDGRTCPDVGVVVIVVVQLLYLLLLSLLLLSLLLLLLRLVVSLVACLFVFCCLFRVSCVCCFVLVSLFFVVCC
ncbi:unnamed protein product [Polarella glacialis]|uniref:Uncharacterized protein n=1 Tax=Polarella glacialis TaxID=89957 RepID=A0A813EDI3_POLGL|nr:unnamed protein product [Polarella glacialis]